MQLEDTIDENGFTRLGYKSTYKNHVTVTKNNLLDNTYWMLVRKKERNIDVPAEITTERAAVTTEYDRLIAAIDAATTTEDVDEAFKSASWPEQD
jgi:hypothetical protein